MSATLNVEQKRRLILIAALRELYASDLDDVKDYQPVIDRDDITEADVEECLRFHARILAYPGLLD